MQDRIKELAIEAGLLPNHEVYEEDLTRFAQAIARECAEIVGKEIDRLKWVQNSISSSGVDAQEQVCQFLMHQILARFGIAKAVQPTTCGQCSFMGSYGHGEPPPCNHPKRGNVGPWEFANPRETPPKWCPVGIAGE